MSQNIYSAKQSAVISCVDEFKDAARWTISTQLLDRNDLVIQISTRFISKRQNAHWVATITYSEETDHFAVQLSQSASPSDIATIKNGLRKRFESHHLHFF